MIVGLIGSPRVGKDEVANFLVKYYNFKKIAFADQIKQEYFAYSKTDEREFEKLKKLGTCGEVRKELWNYSKMLKDKNGKDYFIKSVFNKINKDDSWVITDIRTKLELKYVLDNNVTIFVVRKTNLINNICESELSIDNIKEFDTIINNQTLGKLEEKLRIFFGEKIYEIER